MRLPKRNLPDRMGDRFSSMMRGADSLGALKQSLSGNEWLSVLSEAGREATETELQIAPYLWREVWARSSQLPPAGEWRIWLLLAGRGFGKTRSGAEFIREGIERGCRRAALVGRTAPDVRDVMVEGESGLLAVCPPWMGALYRPSKRRVIFRGDGVRGAVCTLYSADEPALLRGPQHDIAWADELATWQYREAWDNLLLGLRLGEDPRCCATTTPKRVPIIKELLSDSTCWKTGGSTYDNLANLAPAFIQQIIARYEGTSLGRQELHAEFLQDVEGALWTQQRIEQTRVSRVPCELVRVVVGIDPSASSNVERSNEAGILVGGLGVDGHGYVLEDVSGIYTPHQWATKAVTAYHAWKADRLVAETNNGGDMVEYTVRVADAQVAYKKLTASRGKHTRAEPVAALYERGLIHHVGCFGTLEDQMSSWVPGEDSPDRMDALVWVMTELMLDPMGVPNIRSL